MLGRKQAIERKKSERESDKNHVWKNVLDLQMPIYNIGIRIMIKIIVHFAVSESILHPFWVITDSRLRNFMKNRHQSISG